MRSVLLAILLAGTTMEAAAQDLGADRQDSGSRTTLLTSRYNNAESSFAFIATVEDRDRIVTAFREHLINLGFKEAPENPRARTQDYTILFAREFTTVWIGDFRGCLIARVQKLPGKSEGAQAIADVQTIRDALIAKLHATSDKHVIFNASFSRPCSEPLR